MAGFDLRMTAAEVDALMLRAFPDADRETMWKVTALSPGRASIVRPYADFMLRPGGLISGPNLMALADSAAYALILAHIGEQLMAVTSQLTMNFLRGARPGDLHADAELLHLGRRSAVCDVRLWTESPEKPAAQANVTYALPLPTSAA
ncbi:PaaI family thioesterase [Phenylobacterium sp.]|uniref:PaaI family thioesterase n=1 Tax=Phenylobacterium sp. TaxID=1871053 RepID=UPI0035AD876C